MKRIKLGRKEDMSKVSSETSKSRTFYPTVYISDKKLPIEKEQIGKTMKASVTLKFTGYSENSSDDGKDSYTYNFDIHDISFGDHK